MAIMFFPFFPCTSSSSSSEGLPSLSGQEFPASVTGVDLPLGEGCEAVCSIMMDEGDQVIQVS